MAKAVGPTLISRGGYVSSLLPHDLTNKLRAVAARHGRTLASEVRTALHLYAAMHDRDDVQ
jgi:hypothetical protein